MERDCGVFEFESLGVLGVEFTRDRVFGRRLAWTSCIVVKPCWGTRRLFEVGGTLYGQVRCRVGLVAEFRSGAAIVTLREGMLRPGEEGL
jgi:hypothetical protein